MSTKGFHKFGSTGSLLFVRVTSIDSVDSGICGGCDCAGGLLTLPCTGGDRKLLSARPEVFANVFNLQLTQEHKPQEDLEFLGSARNIVSFHGYGVTKQK